MPVILILRSKDETIQSSLTGPHQCCNTFLHGVWRPHSTHLWNGWRAPPFPGHIDKQLPIEYRLNRFQQSASSLHYRRECLMTYLSRSTGFRRNLRFDLAAKLRLERTFSKNWTGLMVIWTDRNIRQKSKRLKAHSTTTKHAGGWAVEALLCQEIAVIVS